MSNKSPPSTTQEKWVPGKEDPALATAVVYASESFETCGCTLPMEPLLDYLERTPSNDARCPVCQTTIEVVCDGLANPRSSSSEPPAIVTFKYRKNLFRLAVRNDANPSFPNWLGGWIWRSMLYLAGENTTFTAQERIAQVLRMDLHSGMRILHKGKILYPNVQQSSQTISEQLLDICDKGGKPLVMGTRMTEREQKIATLNWCYRLVCRIVGVFLAKAMGLVPGFVSPFVGPGGAGGTLIHHGRPHGD